MLAAIGARQGWRANVHGYPSLVRALRMSIEARREVRLWHKSVNEGRLNGQIVLVVMIGVAVDDVRVRLALIDLVGHVGERGLDEGRCRRLVLGRREDTKATGFEENADDEENEKEDEDNADDDHDDGAKEHRRNRAQWFRRRRVDIGLERCGGREKE